MDQENRRQYKTFYGSRTGNSCAYCWKHHLSMTPAQLKKRECLRRQCDALFKFDHPYWQKREEIKAQRKVRKERIRKQLEEVKSNEVCPEKASGAGR